MSANCLMIGGTMSSAGKSLITSGLCRLFQRRGLRVAPFKSQNMSNFSTVLEDGAEISRAQAIQAAAARIAPSVDMNPILMKPKAEFKSEIFVRGRPLMTCSGREYFRMRDTLWQSVTASLDRLRAENDLILLEGAGSIAELNLMRNDLVNVRIARYAKAPILLVGDIDRGGIFAQLIGSWYVLPPESRSLLRGFIVNKFRGDIALFKDGVRILEERSEGVPVVGVVPMLKNLHIPEEDSASMSLRGGIDDATVEDEELDRAFDALADHLEKHLDLDQVVQIIERGID